MASLTIYAEPWETEGEHKRQILGNVRKERPVWEIALGIIYRARRRGETYEGIKSKAKNSPHLHREELNDENLGLNLSLLQERKLIEFDEKTQRYRTVPEKPLPLR